MSITPNAAARIAAQTRQMQGKDVKCEQCGSEHFYEVQVTRYLSGGSGSVEILADPNEQVHPLLICPCGFPVLPKPAVGRRAGGVFETSHKAFAESIKKSQDVLRASTAKSITNELLPVVAGKGVEDQVAELTKRISKLETDLGAPESPANA